MKTVVITGAARGIGFALVQRAVKRGDIVFATVRKPADAAKFGAHDNLHVIVMDVADTTSVEAAFAEIDGVLAGRKLDAVINPAGISQPGSIELTPVAEFEQTINTNALGSLRVLKAAIPRLRGHGGRAILITSLWGHGSSPMLAAYCMSKHAIESLADCARRETEGMDMHVVVVEPGVVQTDMYYRQGPHVQRSIDAMTAGQSERYKPLYTRYLDIVGGPDGSGVPGAGISAWQCAIDIEQALFDPAPKTRYQSGEDAVQIVAMVTNMSDIEVDAIMRERLNNDPLPAQQMGSKLACGSN